MTASAPQIRTLIAGNWKMNGLRQATQEALKVRDALKTQRNSSRTSMQRDLRVLICPPTTLITALAEATHGTPLTIGAQDCHSLPHGAYTGDVSAEMLADAGASHIIVGHSERRAGHGEIDKDVRKKAEAAYRSGLVAIICIGETAGQRQSDLTLPVVTRQLAGSVPDSATSENTVIAYEPVWAIGTGLIPTLDDVAKVHATIRNALSARFGDQGTLMPILYGGSVKPDNARALLALPNVNGALVGGASLKAADFLEIIAAAQ